MYHSVFPWTICVSASAAEDAAGSRPVSRAQLHMYSVECTSRVRVGVVIIRGPVTYRATPLPSNHCGRLEIGLVYPVAIWRSQSVGWNSTKSIY